MHILWENKQSATWCLIGLHFTLTAPLVFKIKQDQSYYLFTTLSPLGLGWAMFLNIKESLLEKGMWMYLVFETGKTEVKKIKQAVDLWHRQVWDPALQQPCVCVLQHPQKTNQQRPAALCREGATLTARLTKKKTKTHLYYTNTLIKTKHIKADLIRHHIQQPVWDRQYTEDVLTHPYV